MAREFPGTSGNNLIHSVAPVTAAPFTMACWFRPDALGTYDLLSLSNVAGTHYWNLSLRGALGGDPVRLECNAGGSATSCDSTAAPTAGAWNHVVAQVQSATQRRVWLNGGNTASSTSSRTPTGIASVWVGVFAVRLFDGGHANIAFWDVELTTDEIVALSKGASPQLVRPTNLVLYMAENGEGGTSENDLIESVTATAGSGVVKAVDHPRIYYPG